MQHAATRSGNHTNGKPGRLFSKKFASRTSRNPFHFIQDRRAKKQEAKQQTQEHRHHPTSFSHTSTETIMTFDHKNNSKRAAVDYEADLAAYTSSRNESPDHSTQRSTKRARRSTSTPTSTTATTKTPFEVAKEGYFQQHVERLNQQLKDELAALQGSDSDTDKSVMLVAESLRILKDVKALYQQPTGIVLAMGNDDCNALGVAITDDDDKEVEYPPTLVRNIPQHTIIHVAAGGTHSAALAVDGTAYTWGNNDDFALGRGAISDSDIHKAGPVSTLAQSVVGIAAGDNHVLFLTIDGHVYMSGMYKDIDSGKFANLKPGQKPQEGLQQPVPVKIEMPQKVFKVAAGHACNAAILKDKSLVTWGMGHSGELGRSSSMGADITTTEGGFPQYNLGKMFIGEIRTKMDKDKEGKLVEVEYFKYHTEMINDKFLTPAPVEWQTPGQYEVLDVAIGESHMVVVARQNNGPNRVYSCGLNQYGQLGHGDQISRHALAPIETLDGHEVVQVACGTHHTLFLNALGNFLFACGRSDYGQLGLFDQKDEAGGYQTTPAPVSFPKELRNTRISFIAAGCGNSAAVTDAGNVYTWGFNETASTGHPSKNRNGSMDIERATQLNPMRWYSKKEPSMGETATVSSLSLGGQHALMVVKPYKK